MRDTTCTRTLQVILKVSKLCNLRCRYCYELDHLSERAAMRPEQLRGLYARLGRFLVERDRIDGQRTRLQLVWHGGEPLLRPPSFYWQTFADQQALRAEHDVMNVVQTNLTVLDPERTRLLRDGFDGVGVSFDAIDGMRVDIRGRSRSRQVAQNIDALRAAGVPVACIAVLTAAGLPRIDAIFGFFAAAGVSLRVLPLFAGAWAEQHRGYEISREDILQAYMRLFELWLASDQTLEVLPIAQHVRTA
ncbi:MAG TPA: radical SAM protein, partial [Nannocystis exedens]|nr:radical SAM protein [Nannocystis exedens]